MWIKFVDFAEDGKRDKNKEKKHKKKKKGSEDEDSDKQLSPKWVDWKFKAG